jgi:hypothetical protein
VKRDCSFQREKSSDLLFLSPGFQFAVKSNERNQPNISSFNVNFRRMKEHPRFHKGLLCFSGFPMK